MYKRLAMPNCYAEMYFFFQIFNYEPCSPYFKVLKKCSHLLSCKKCFMTRHSISGIVWDN